MCVTACQNVMVSWASLLNGKTFVHVYDIDVIDKNEWKNIICVDAEDNALI
jgi:hypothetical protein